MVLLGFSSFSQCGTKKFGNLKQHTRHPKLSLEIGLTQSVLPTVAIPSSMFSWLQNRCIVQSYIDEKCQHIGFSWIEKHLLVTL